MDRRTFLATAWVTVLSGCSSLSAESGTPTRTGTPPPSSTNSSRSETTSQGGNSKGVLGSGSVIDLETASRTYALTPTQYYTVDEGKIQTKFTATETRDHPATLTATLTNTNDYEDTFHIQWTPPFGYLTSRIPHAYGDESKNATGDVTYREEIVFAPTANHDLVDVPPDIELASDGYWRLAEGVDQWLPNHVQLAPGETIHGEYAVVGLKKGVGKGRPPGVYEFRGRGHADLRLAVWNPTQPGPATRSRFAGVSLPPLPFDESTAWYHDATERTQTYLEPSTETGSLPEQIRFTFVNKSAASPECGGWNLYELTGGSWTHVGPNGHNASCRVLGPGETASWTLNLYSGEALPSIHPGRDGASFGHLTPGRYAVTVGFGGNTSRSAALVELT